MRRLIVAALVVVGTIVVTEVRLSEGRLQRRVEGQIGSPSRWEPRPPGSTRLLPWPRPVRVPWWRRLGLKFIATGVAQMLPNPDALPPRPDPRMILSQYAKPSPPGPVVRRQFYWINKWRYARHVGRNACRADTGEYVGQVTRVEYVVTRNSKEWVYVFDRPHKGPVTIRPEPNRHSARVQQAVALAMSGSATEFTVTNESCRDGRPGTSERTKR